MTDGQGGAVPRSSGALILLSSLQTGGAERVTVSFARCLAERGETVTLCTLSRREDGALAAELTKSGIRRLDLQARRLADPHALRRLVDLLGRERFTLVHAHGQDASIMGAAACAVTKVPLIVTRHVLDEPQANWRQRLRSRAALMAFARADVPVAVSDAAGRRLAELANLPPQMVVVLRNGIDLARFNRPELRQASAAFRRSLGFRPDDQLVLLPAVLRPGKGHDLMLRAWPAILEAQPSAKLILAGAGELEGQLRDAAEPHGESVVFLGQRDDMAELMTASDLIVLPSQAEALPTVLMEAAATGRAVVATDVGGTAEVVEHGRTGLLTIAGDPKAFGEAIRSLLSDAAMRQSFGNEARAMASRRFGLERQVEETLTLWRQVAGGARP